MTMNDIISKVVKYYASLPGDIEISTFEALEKVCKVDFDPDPKGEYLIDNIPMGFCELFNLNNLKYNGKNTILTKHTIYNKKTEVIKFLLIGTFLIIMIISIKT